LGDRDLSLAEGEALGWRNPDNAAAYGRFVEEFPMYRLTSRDLVRRLGAVRGRTVLDLCCGTGATTSALLEVIGDGRVVAVDGSPAMLHVARQVVRDERVTWIESPAEALVDTFDGRLPPIDAVVCNSAIWQTRMPDVLPSVSSLLPVGGRVVFNIGTEFLAGLEAATVRTRPDLHLLMLAAAILDHGHVPRGGPAGHRMSVTAVEDLLRHAGLEVSPPEIVEYETSIEQSEAWLSIPIFTERFHGLTYEQRMDCLRTASSRVDRGGQDPVRWAIFGGERLGEAGSRRPPGA
jgi:SAM-dependent methyltransferase